MSGNSGETVASVPLNATAFNFIQNGTAHLNDYSLTATTLTVPSAALVYSPTATTLTVPSAAATYLLPATVTSYSATIATKTPYVLYTSGGDPASQVGESTTAYQNLFSFTIPGGALGTHGSVEVEWGGDVLHPAGLTGNTGIKVLLNSTNVISNSSNQIGDDNDPYPLKGSLVVGLKGDVAKQRVTHWVAAGNPGGSTGNGGWLYGKNRGVMTGDGTEDSRSNLTVTVQVKFTVSDASHYFRLYHVKATVYPDIN